MLFFRPAAVASKAAMAERLRKGHGKHRSGNSLAPSRSGLRDARGRCRQGALRRETWRQEHGVRDDGGNLNRGIM